MKDPRKKILYIITKSVWAGAGKYTHDLAINLPREKFKIMVAAGGHEKMAQKIEKAGIPYYEIKHFQKDVGFFNDFFAFLEIIKLLLKTRPNIMHVSSSKAGGIAGAASFCYSILSFGSPLLKIFTAHGWAFEEKRPRYQIWLIKRLSKITCHFYNKIICVSDFDKQAALKYKIAPARKLTAIHNGIKPEDYDTLTKDRAREQLAAFEPKLESGQKENELWIGAIGEFTKNKGYKYLIEAAKKLKTLELKFKIIIVGFGKDKEELQKQIKELKLNGRVFLIENLPKPANYLKAFDIFTMPSLKEGLPYVLLEAGIARLPVVATKTGGIPEIIINEETGLLIEPENPEEIAQAIEKLITNLNLKGDVAFKLWERINRDFMFDKMMEATIEAYNRN